MTTIRKQDPLKQGLKPQISLGDDQHEPCTEIRKQDPLKQGLKPILTYALTRKLAIRKQDPLKQGLKLHLVASLHCREINSKARSTKTRIETSF